MTMDATNARRLVTALRADDKELRTLVELPGGSFYVNHAANMELEFDPAASLLIARRAPVGFPLDHPPEEADTARARGQYDKNAAVLAPTTLEIVQLHAQPGKWYTVLRWDFESSRTTDKQFVTGMTTLRKMMGLYRR